jgi:hypothetical protein
MKLYALFTLHETGWGTRAGVGDRTLFISDLQSLANHIQLLSLLQQLRNSKQHQAITMDMPTRAKTRSTSSLTVGSIDEMFRTGIGFVGCHEGVGIIPN